MSGCCEDDLMRFKVTVQRHGWNPRVFWVEAESLEKAQEHADDLMVFFNGARMDLSLLEKIEECSMLSSRKLRLGRG